MPPAPSDRRIPLAMITLGFPGRVAEFAVPVPVGPSRLMDLLPAARELANREAQATNDRAREAGFEISCHYGCAACCHHLIVISAIEARALAELVDSMPPERRAVIRGRFAETIRRLEDAGILDRNEPVGNRHPHSRYQASSPNFMPDLLHRYLELRIPCPFLENESCSIYEVRPSICRQHHVISPYELCALLPADVPVKPLRPSFHVSELLASLATRLLAVEHGTLMLAMALEWSEAHGESFEATGDGVELFTMMMNEIAARLQSPEAAPTDSPGYQS